MKNLTKMLVAVGCVVGSMSLAHAGSDAQLIAADNAVSSKICVVAAKGNMHKLQRTLKSVGLSRDFVVNNITCNNMPIVEFVEQYGENVTAINRYITSGEYTGQLVSRNAL